MCCLSKIDESNRTTMNFWSILVQSISQVQKLWGTKWGMHYFCIKSEPTWEVKYFLYSTIIQTLCTDKGFNSYPIKMFEIVLDFGTFTATNGLKRTLSSTWHTLWNCLQKSPHLWYELAKVCCWNQRKVLRIVILVLYPNIIITTLYYKY